MLVVGCDSLGVSCPITKTDLPRVAVHKVACTRLLHGRYVIRSSCERFRDIQIYRDVFLFLLLAV